MKVYEIITPQPLNEFSLNPSNWFGAKDTAKKAKQAAYDATAVKDLVAIAKQKYPNLSPAAGKAMAGISAGVVKISKEKAAVLLADKIGNWSYAFKILGVTAISVNLYYNFVNLEDKSRGGELTASQYKEAHEFYWGMWVIQFFAPWLAQALGTAKIVNFLIRLIVGILTLGFSVGTAGVGIFATISALAIEQAVFTAFQAFLMSKTFESWMAQDFIRPIIVGAGKVPDASWNALRAELSTWPGLDKIFKGKGKDFYQAAADQAPNAKPDTGKFGKLNNPNAAANAVVIDGTNIVGPDGKLDDFSFMKPSVQIYIKHNPNDPEVKKIPSIPRAADSIYK
jgi:hypothetical protein